MHPIAAALIPLGAFWASFNALVAAAKYVNQVREQVAIGKVDNNELAPDHRHAMFIDWCLLMSASVLASWCFAGAVIWASFYLSDVTTFDVGTMPVALLLIGGFQAIYGVMFTVCGYFDLKMLRRRLSDAQ